MNDITKDLHKKLGDNRQAYHVITENRWGVEDVNVEHDVAEEHMNKVIQEARKRDDPRAKM